LSTPVPTAAEQQEQPTPERTPLRLVVVHTPQPPVVEQAGPLRLVDPDRRSPRPRYRPGPRLPEERRGPAAEFGPEWSLRADLPDAAATGRRVLLLALEALAGRRPMAQLQSAVSPRLFAALSAGRRPRWCTEGTAPLVLGRVHVCEPVDGVAEVSAVARRGGRAHAVAARLEGLDGRWRCTALQIG
jgi:hypothetical protein